MPDPAKHLIDIRGVGPGSRTVERLGEEPVARERLVRKLFRQPEVLVGADELREPECEVADVALDVEAPAVRGEQAERERRSCERAERHAEEEHPLLGTTTRLR